MLPDVSDRILKLVVDRCNPNRDNDIDYCESFLFYAVPLLPSSSTPTLPPPTLSIADEFTSALFPSVATASSSADRQAAVQLAGSFRQAVLRKTQGNNEELARLFKDLAESERAR